MCAVLEMQKSGKKCLIFLGHFSCLKRIDYDVVPLLEGPKFTPDAGTVPIGPRGTVRFLKEMNLKLYQPSQTDEIQPTTLMV